MGQAARRRFLGVWAAITAATMAAAVACSNAGEGDRCEILNGSEDCQSGLVCTQVASQASSVCCPPDRRNATALACTQNTSPITGDAAPPPDTGPPEEPPTPDAGEETDAAGDDENDAAADAADDATTDAAADDAAADDASDDAATP